MSGHHIVAYLDTTTGAQPVGVTKPLPTTSQGYEVSLSITRPANTTAYTANDVIGTATSGGAAILTFASIGPSSGGKVLITEAMYRVDKTSVPSGMTSFTLHLYSSSPGSVLNDNDAWDLPSGDRSAYLGYIDLGTVADVGSTLFVQSQQVKQVTVPSGGSLYGYLVTVGGYTPASGDVQTVTLKAIGV